MTKLPISPQPSVEFEAVELETVVGYGGLPYPAAVVVGIAKLDGPEEIWVATLSASVELLSGGRTPELMMAVVCM